MKLILPVLSLVVLVFGQKDPHFWPGRNTIVHLFEWKWLDIAQECENFLQHKGYGGVQVSPPNENLIVKNRPWWERYQPVSYKLITRSGNENEFINMTRRCNKVGIRIYVDAVINHMSAGSGTGTGGSTANYEKKLFPAVPYGPSDFHPINCVVTNHNDKDNVRNCQLVGLIDLDQSSEHVRGKIGEYFNHLIDVGVAGFRVDAARHMLPSDLKVIFSRLKTLNVDYGFAPGSKPFIYQEVIDLGSDVIGTNEFKKFGTVTEFKYGEKLGNVFRGNDKLTYLVNWGEGWGLINGLDAVAFIDNHDTQRNVGTSVLTYKQSKQYKMAIAFMLAHPYGTTRVMSSYAFDHKDQAPPSDANAKLLSPKINEDDTCSNGYICEHRWRQIYNMVGFRNAVMGTEIKEWWSNGDQQIAFCRGNKGFIAFTNWGNFDQTLQTCLAPGTYCDVISGNLVQGKCTGKKITVQLNGQARIVLGALEEDGVLAIHANSRLK